MRIATLCLLLVIHGQTAAQENRETVIGSGVSSTDARSVDKFHKVSIQGSGMVRIDVGKDQQVKLTVDDNLMQFVTTEVSDGELIIRWKPKTNISTKLGLTANIQLPKLSKLTIEGAAEASIHNATGPQLEVEIEGSGSVEATGKVENVAINISGSGEIDMGSLASKNAAVSIAGSGDVFVDVSKALTASINGSGDIRYSGEPVVTRSVTGSGSIAKK